MKKFFCKFLSMKVLFSVASMIVIYIIVLKQMTAFQNLALTLVAPIVTYVWANVKQDEVELKYSKKEETKEEEKA